MIDWYEQNEQKLPLPPVLPLLAHQGPERWTFSCEFVDFLGSVPAALRPFLPNFQHGLVDLSQIDEPDLSSQARLRAFLKALKYGRRKDLGDYIDLVLAESRGLEDTDLFLILRYLERLPARVDSEMMRASLQRWVPERTENIKRIGASSSGTLSSLSIWQAVSAKLREPLPTERDPHNSMTFGSPADPELLLSRLSFSHFAELITIEKQEERAFYEIECVRGAWSVRELKRQIGSLYFERSAFSRDPQRLVGLLQADSAALDPKFSFRDPYVFEFLGLRPPEVMGESDLEDALLDRLQAFMLELGHGFCFEARQKRIQIGDTICFIDLVFYHRILKCHVLIELKVADFNHEHLGQLNTYVSWYKRNMITDGDSPPIGLLLCKRKDNALVHYALADLPNTVFVSKYQVELPTVDQLRNLLNAPAEDQRPHERRRVEPPAP